jgi:hypothetical protein
VIAHPEAYLAFMRLQLAGLLAREELGCRVDWASEVRELLTQIQQTPAGSEFPNGKGETEDEEIN